MDIVTGMNLSTAIILALLILFMKFETSYLKRLAILAVILFFTPLIFAFVGNSMGWFDVSLIEIMSLHKGAFSILLTVAYGLMAGVILNGLKLYLIDMFRKSCNKN